MADSLSIDLARKRLQELRSGAVKNSLPESVSPDSFNQARQRLAQLRQQNSPTTLTTAELAKPKNAFQKILEPIKTFGLTTGAAIGKVGFGAGEAILRGAGKLLEPRPKSIISSNTKPSQFLKRAAEATKLASQRIFTDPFKKELGTTLGKAGDILGQGITFLAPTGGITSAQQILTKAVPKLPTILGRATSGVGRLVARAVPEALGSAAVELARTGGNTEEAKKAGKIGGAISVGLGALGGLARSVFGSTPLSQSVTKALGLTGKTTGGRVLPQVEKKVAGLKVLNDLAPEIKVLDEAGIEKVFDPKQATFGETLQAWNQARKKIYNEYHSLAVGAGDTATPNFSGAVKNLEDIVSGPRTSAYKISAKNLLEDIKRNFATVDETGKITGWKPANAEQVEQFLADLNNEAAAAISGRGRSAAGDVAADIATKVRAALDESIEKAGGVRYSGLKKNYGALKEIENDLVNRFKQEARRLGAGVGDYLQAFNSGDLVAGVLTANPQLFLTGLSRGALVTAIKMGRTPQRFLRRSFSQLSGSRPSELSLRLFGGTRPLTGSERAFSSNIGSSMTTPFAGLSIKEVALPKQLSIIASRAGVITPQEIKLNLKSLFPQANQVALKDLADEISKIKSPEALRSFLNEKASWVQVMLKSASSESSQTAMVQRLVRQAKETERLRGSLASPFIKKEKGISRDFQTVFHPDDQKFLSEFASKVKARKPVSIRDIEIAKEVYARAGFNTPSSKTKLADLISSAENSAETNRLFSQMDKSLSGRVRTKTRANFTKGYGGRFTGSKRRYAI